MRWRKSLGKPVIDRSSGETIGEVTTLIASVESHRITGIVVDDRIAPWSTTRGIGHDAVTVPSVDALTEPTDGDEKRIVDGDVDPLGRSVYTEDGFALGSLTDIDFDADTGEIGRLLLADDDLAGSRMLGIGSFAVVVRSRDRTGAEADLSDLSKAELYERARARDLPGRSDMTKQELIAALS